MLIPLLANRAMLSADKVSIVTMVCWSLDGTAPASTLIPTAGETVVVPVVVPVVAVAGTFLFR